MAKQQLNLHKGTYFAGLAHQAASMAAFDRLRELGCGNLFPVPNTPFIHLPPDTVVLYAPVRTRIPPEHGCLYAPAVPSGALDEKLFEELTREGFHRRGLRYAFVNEAHPAARDRIRLGEHLALALNGQHELN